MRLQTNSVAFVVLLAFLTMIGPLSTDIFLPSLPSIARTFGTTVAVTEATLTGYFVGFAIAQLIYGPISDRVGRRPVLLVGLAAYTVGGFICIFAPTIGWLIAARVVQAIAAAAPIILARTIVRDIHAGVRAGQLLSVMSSIMGLFPLLAPALGGFLELRFGWQSSFWVMAILGAVALPVTALLLPETIRERRVERLSLSAIIASYGYVARSRVFRIYASMVCFAYAGLIVYVGVSSFIVQGRYGLSPVGYGLTFEVGAAAYIAGTFLGRIVARRAGLDPAIGVSTVFLAVGGLLLPLAVAFGPDSVAGFVIPVAIFMIGIGAIIPQALAAALTPFPERAGAASSLIGFLHMSTGAIVLLGAGALFGDDAILNACVLGAGGLAAFLVFAASGRVRARFA